MDKQQTRTTEGRGQLYDSITDTVGNTPCVRINRLAPAGVKLYVKLEYFNPASSVKDRLAINIIEDAERRGTLRPGQTVVEAKAATPASASLWFARRRAIRWWSRWRTASPSSAGS
jgi:cysteine synthase A